MLADLQQQQSDLKKDFERSVFGSYTLNMGPQTVAGKHRDRLNKLSGWCAITALGNFNDISGGHLVLWDLELVIRFPAGSTILIPSALLYHSNTSISNGENRYSFTQYTAGHLFQWVENGHKSRKELTANMSEHGQDGKGRMEAGRYLSNLHSFLPFGDLSRTWS